MGEDYDLTSAWIKRIPLFIFFHDARYISTSACLLYVLHFTMGGKELPCLLTHVSRLGLDSSVLQWTDLGYKYRPVDWSRPGPANPNCLNIRMWPGTAQPTQCHLNWLVFFLKCLTNVASSVFVFLKLTCVGSFSNWTNLVRK